MCIFNNIGCDEESIFSLELSAIKIAITITTIIGSIGSASMNLFMQNAHRQAEEEKHGEITVNRAIGENRNELFWRLQSHYVFTASIALFFGLILLPSWVLLCFFCGTGAIDLWKMKILFLVLSIGGATHFIVVLLLCKVFELIFNRTVLKINHNS
jgi:hypothetical protein